MVNTSFREKIEILHIFLFNPHYNEIGMDSRTYKYNKIFHRKGKTKQLRSKYKSISKSKEVQ